MSIEDLLRLERDTEWVVRGSGVEWNSPATAPDQVANFRKLMALARYEVAHGREVDPNDAVLMRELALEIRRVFGVPVK